MSSTFKELRPSNVGNSNDVSLSLVVLSTELSRVKSTFVNFHFQNWSTLRQLPGTIPVHKPKIWRMVKLSTEIKNTATGSTTMPHHGI